MFYDGTLHSGHGPGCQCGTRLGGGRYLFLLRLPKEPGVKLRLSVNGAPFFDGTLEALRRADS